MENLIVKKIRFLLKVLINKNKMKDKEAIKSIGYFFNIKLKKYRKENSSLQLRNLLIELYTGILKESNYDFNAKLLAEDHENYYAILHDDKIALIKVLMELLILK